MQGAVDEQRENLERVSTRITPWVKRFCREHKRFHADALHEYVIRMTGIAAPASADRILRNLRQAGQLSYHCVNRRESLYEVLWVK